MSDAKILTHPAFDRLPVENVRRPGRPAQLPRNVIDLFNARVCLARQGRDPGEAMLRAWARQNRLNDEAPVERIRGWKAEQEVVDRAATGSDRAAWAEIERLKSAAFRLYNEVSDTREKLLERHRTDSGQ